MPSMEARLVVLVLTAGILSACAGAATQAPVSPPTETLAPATQAPATAPATEASAPSADATQTAQMTTGTGISFTKDIVPILDGRCVNCHGRQRTEEGLVLKSYSDIMQGSKNGMVVVPGDASNSLLAQLVENQKMPKRGPKLTPSQVQLIVDWINQGALDN